MPRPKPWDSYSNTLNFTTLGEFRLSTISHGPSFSRQTDSDVISGPGSYATIGARIFSPSGNPSYLSKTIGWILDAGHDLPKDVLWILNGHWTNLIVRRDESRRTTRCMITHGTGDTQIQTQRGAQARALGQAGGFAYLTDFKTLEVKNLVDNGLVKAKCVHMIGSPSRTQIHIEELRRVTKEATAADTDSDTLDTPKQVLIWELEREWCKPEQRAAMIHAASDVDVVIMTSSDLLGFWKDIEHEMPNYGEELKISYLTPMMLEEVNKTGQTTTAVVIRDGKLGTLVATPEMLNAPEKFKMLPPYYREGDTMVVDTEGAGNAFAGGMGVGLVRTGDVVKAAAMGVVAESFVVEQVGIPHLESTDTGEMWNDDFCSERMKKYVEMLKTSGIELELDIIALGIQWDPDAYDDEDDEEEEEEEEEKGKGKGKEKNEKGERDDNDGDDDDDDDDDDDWEVVEAENPT
ncbi:hypothetical protein FPQ18DRAFT_402418 [Pyronema domesticum]|uniref:Similar to Uncharacterized protein C16C9.01c acc. no. Q09839 n=1 Tax=Pyronema omphalodes (strain CBS 100304) TaxID=1076935 RepID=U4LV63_PYROM|nr:hypothetical protein FPQ18DRAFT_402418 [Pyronema domesticum]CCX34297.1 Similar to Uncharacterized protein C16C9.01c; acc. no. Q09839 [Pyronema omphalodes CBS 100304]